MATSLVPPKFPEFYEVVKAAMLAADTEGKISDRSFTEGYLLDIITGSIAAILEEDAERSAARYLQHFLKRAEGDDLTALVKDHWNLDRLLAFAAVGIANFSRPTDGAGAVSIPAGTRLSTSDGVEFSTDLQINFGATDLSAQGAITASVAGESGNVAASTITQIIDPIAADPTITVTNSAATAGGIDEESDARLRQRVPEFVATLPRGTKAAIEYGAKQVAGVIHANVDETTDPFTLWIADTNGEANAALISAVETELLNWRAAGTINMTVDAATVVAQAITMALVFEAGRDTASVRDAAVKAAVDYVNSLSVGDRIYHFLLQKAVGAVDGILSVDVTNPAGDVVANPDELIRTDVSQVTLS